jgi:hypothetical protein
MKAAKKRRHVIVITGEYFCSKEQGIHHMVVRPWLLMKDFVGWFLA